MKTVYLHTILKCCFVIGYCLIFTPPASAEVIQTCVNGQGKTIFTDTGCPPGFISKTGEGNTAKIVRRDITPATVNEKDNNIIWQKHNIVLEDISMSWLLTRKSQEKKAILHPQVVFTVHNSGTTTLGRLKIIMLFYDESNKLFGDTYKYTKKIEPDKRSSKLSLSPSKGFVYSGYNEEKITVSKFKVDVYGRYLGDKEKIGSLEFFSTDVQRGKAITTD